MSFMRNQIDITVHGDPSVGINSLHDVLELQWDLDEDGERERIRTILHEAWAQLYDDGGISVRFGDECPDCGGLGTHTVGCPSDSFKVMKGL
jgi:hypothetical protein